MYLLTALAAFADPVNLSALCSGDCEISERLDAGTDAEGHALQVVKGAMREVEGAPCRSVRYWGIVLDGDTLVRHQLLVEGCETGNEETDDHIEVSNNRFTHARKGQDMWTWGVAFTLQLSPLKILATEGYSAHPVAKIESSGRWSLESFEGSELQRMPPCREEDEADMMAAVTLPLVTIEPAPDDPDSIALGSCAASVDAGNAATIVEGSETSTSDTRLRAVMVSETELWVEVWDDMLVKKGPHTDAVLLYLSEETEGNWCDGDIRPVGWAFDIRKGKVSSTAGSGTPPKVLHHERAGQFVRMRVQLPEPVAAITVGYRDVDQELERIVATSQVDPENPITLGRVRKVNPENTICAVVDGSLEHRDVQDPERFQPDVAVIQH